MHGRKIMVDGQEFEWVVTQGINDGQALIAAMEARGQFVGVVIWDADRKQYKAPLRELSATPVEKDSKMISILPGQVEAWIKSHILVAT